MAPRPGEVILKDAWRSFSPRGDQGRTLKELIAQRGRRRGPELPPTQALAGVTLTVAPGDTLGIVGRNGAGKTSTLRVLAGIIPLHRGIAAVGGRVATLIDLSSGFGREFTGRENIHLTAALHGMSRAEVEARIDSIIAFSELGHFVDAPIKTYSSGMLVRLGFAIAAHLEADVLLIDEVLAVGDEAFQRKCLRHIAQRIEAGTTLVLVSHAPATIEAVCRRVVVLDHGRVTFDGPTADGLRHYHELLGGEDAEQARARDRDDSPVWIERAWLADGDGHPREVFEAGEPLRLVVELAAREGAPDVALALHVRDAGGRSVFSARESLPTGRGGGGRLEIEIERLALLGGDYEVPLGVDIPGDPVTGVDRLLRFSVRPAPGGEGLVDLRGTWAFHPARVAR
jgi:ABC-type polysaccharide/polyol phosphate transport system ATPase subunit